MSFYTHLLKENTYENTRISRIKLAKISFPGGASGKEPTCQCRRLWRHRCSPRVGRIPWRRAWQPTPVFLPAESQGQRNLVVYSP